MSLNKIRAALSQADDLANRISQLTRVRELINPQYDSTIIPSQFPDERAYLPAGVAKQAINEEITRLQQRMDALLLRINAAGNELP